MGHYCNTETLTCLRDSIVTYNHNRSANRSALAALWPDNPHVLNFSRPRSVKQSPGIRAAVARIWLAANWRKCPPARRPALRCGDRSGLQRRAGLEGFQTDSRRGPIELFMARCCNGRQGYIEHKVEMERRTREPAAVPMYSEQTASPWDLSTFPLFQDM